ncbi:hypothetical protein BURPS1655_E0719 [Burkholderia pseudomallei 1655]|nr:hypothetical protein BURPS1655_E0719 [Burkholderia pseudomallei 1655]
MSRAAVAESPERLAGWGRRRTARAGADSLRRARSTSGVTRVARSQ